MALRLLRQLHPFRPRLLAALKGYARRRLLTDISAGITVGVVALPLAMAFAIASGVKPEQGIVTAIVAGFLISALGGSSVQIGAARFRIAQILDYRPDQGSGRTSSRSDF